MPDTRSAMHAAHHASHDVDAVFDCPEDGEVYPFMVVEDDDYGIVEVIDAVGPLLSYMPVNTPA